ncbi:MAG: nucleoside monophosphate kinase [Candidatus Woesearchaeota archaeon]
MTKILVLFGPPGAGKGTLAEHLSNKFGFFWISTGDLLREIANQDNELGRKIKNIISQGKLLDDETLNKIIYDNIKTKDFVLLDGYPRKISQAEFLEKNFEVIGSIFVFCDDEKIVQRLTNRRICPKCKKNYNLLTNPPKKDNLCDICNVTLIQREDDKEEVIRKRLKIYYEETHSLYDFYKTRNKIIELNSDLPIEKYLNVGEEKIKKILKIK